MSKRKTSTSTTSSTMKKRKTSTAASNAKIAKIVAGAEYHYLDTAISTNVTTTPTVVQLTTIAQGDTIASRQGAKIQTKSIDLRMRFTRALVTDNQDDCIRVMVVVDRQANGNSLTAAELLTASTIQSHSNATAFGRFHVLMDETFAFNQSSLLPATATAANREQHFLHKFIKVPPAWSLVNYNQTTATVPYSNSICVFYYGINVAEYSQVAGEARLKFIG